MPARLEDYALIGNRETAALVARDGSIDWFCIPRFDGSACFAALLGTTDHGRWLIAPRDAATRVTRCYRNDDLVLETRIETASASLIIIDGMGIRDDAPEIIRQIEVTRGTAALRLELIARFEYGQAIPEMIRHEDGAISMVAGPDRLTLTGDAKCEIQDHRIMAEFELAAGASCVFSLLWSRSYQPVPARANPRAVLAEQSRCWREWVAGFTWNSEWAEPVKRSLIILKALTSARTGGMVGAPTTSLPEQLGGKLNWDYRYCWLRDATFALRAFLHAGLTEEAVAWRAWLLRALGGDAAQIQIMYGIGGERRLDETNASWLPGYEKSSPVRFGNDAAGQVQFDIYGDLLDALYLARKKGVTPLPAAWAMECQLLDHLMKTWRQPGNGIWEARGSEHQFTLSKAMSWVAFDRAIHSAEEFGLDGPVPQWRQHAAAIHQEVCQSGFNPDLGSFVQYYGGDKLDAGLLRLAPMGFLPASDPRIQGTIRAIERELMADGLVFRFKTKDAYPNLPAREGAFIACGFWLVENYVLAGRKQEARDLFERLLALSNDVGLLSEEYDLNAKRLVGNFPQALSHLALVNAACRLEREHVVD